MKGDECGEGITQHRSSKAAPQKINDAFDAFFGGTNEGEKMSKLSLIVIFWGELRTQ